MDALYSWHRKVHFQNNYHSSILFSGLLLLSFLLSQFGLKQKIHLQGKGNERFSKILVDIYQNVKPELTIMDGVGETVADSIISWFSDSHNKKLLENLLALVSVKKIAVSKNKIGKLNGKVLVITGALPSLSRDEAKEIIRKQGGNVSGSVSKSTDFVIVGENAGSKLGEAKKLGVPVISEQEFLKMV